MRPVPSPAASERGLSCAMERWWRICGAGNPNVQVWLPEEEPGRGRVARALAEFLVRQVREDREIDAAGRAGLLISTVNGVDVAESVIAPALLEAGFVAGAKGFNVRRLAARAYGFAGPRGGTPSPYS